MPQWAGRGCKGGGYAPRAAPRAANREGVPTAEPKRRSRGGRTVVRGNDGPWTGGVGSGGVLFVSGALEDRKGSVLGWFLTEFGGL